MAAVDNMSKTSSVVLLGVLVFGSALGKYIYRLCWRHPLPGPRDRLLTLPLRNLPFSAIQDPYYLHLSSICSGSSAFYHLLSFESWMFRFTTSRFTSRLSLSLHVRRNVGKTFWTPTQLEKGSRKFSPRVNVLLFFSLSFSLSFACYPISVLPVPFPSGTADLPRHFSFFGVSGQRGFCLSIQIILSLKSLSLSLLPEWPSPLPYNTWMSTTTLQSSFYFFCR